MYKACPKCEGECQVAHVTMRLNIANEYDVDFWACDKCKCAWPLTEAEIMVQKVLKKKEHG